VSNYKLNIEFDTTVSYVRSNNVASCYTGKYVDVEDTSRVPDSGDFVPFMRSSEVLDPTHADSPLPISREPTDMVKARRAYQRELNPAKYGHVMDHRVSRLVTMAFVLLESVRPLLCVLIVFICLCLARLATRGIMFLGCPSVRLLREHSNFKMKELILMEIGTTDLVKAHRAKAGNDHL